MTGTPDTDGPADAIDADFEPAPVADHVVPSDQKPKGGPGWAPFGLVSALALGSMGLSAASFFSSNEGSPDSLAQKVSSVELAQQDTAAQLDALQASASAAEKRMADEIEALLAGDDNALGLEALVAELEAVSGRLDDATDPAAFAALETRLSALENIDDDETGVTPRDLRVALTTLRSRIDALESENAELTKQLESRADAVAALTARIEDMEFAQAGTIGSPNSGALLTDLQAEIDNLKTTVERSEDLDQENQERFAEILSSLQSAEIAEENDKNRDAAFQALADIENLAREGRSFYSEFEQLRAVTPASLELSKLGSFARSDTPTLKQLQERFSGDYDAAIAAIDKQAEADWGWTKSIFGSGVKVRRASEADGPKEQLNAAASALKSGDLKSAIDELDTLRSDVKTIMSDWLVSAKARRELDLALNDAAAQLEKQEW